jgi:putative Mg2+ transporter-C (MgtC) family protein
MEPLLEGWLGFPDLAQVGRLTLRLVVAALIGGLLGFEREAMGKAAGLRTHMLVALGAALFVMVPVEAGMSGELGRVVQGIAAGVGFLGAGTILKRSDRQEVTGLTTAASIWLTAALGVAAGVSRIWLPVAGAVLAWIILYVVAVVERRVTRKE